VTASVEWRHPEVVWPQRIPTPYHHGLLATPDCDNCPLKYDPKVLPDGPIPARLAIVAENPDREEVKQGRGLVGPTGQLLWTMWARAGVDRAAVWVSNSFLSLEGRSLVRMADGSNRRISDIVKHAISGPAVGVDMDGRFVPCEITGWIRSALGSRKLVRVTPRYAKGNPRGATGVVLTDEHELLTLRGMIPARCIESSDRVATGSAVPTGASLGVLMGSILGNATMHKQVAELTISQQLDNADYVTCKRHALSTMGCSDVVLDRVNGRARFSVLSNRWLRSLRDGIYVEQRSRPSWWKRATPELLALSDAAVAIWFLDDGYLDKKGLAELACCDFTAGAAQLLADALWRRGLPCRMALNHDYARIYFDKYSSSKLQDIVAPFAPPSMQYKLDADHRGSFNPNAYNPCPVGPFFDAVSVTPVEPQMDSGRKTPRPMYCLQTSTGNFLTATGGVVSNCRPRRVQLANGLEIPEETVKSLAARACRARLIQELIIVAPTVVVPIGNWALWSLSDIPRAKITDYRGARLEVDLPTLLRLVQTDQCRSRIKTVKEKDG
jgi:uracil-DNA glycosylase